MVEIISRLILANNIKAFNMTHCRIATRHVIINVTQAARYYNSASYQAEKRRRWH